MSSIDLGSAGDDEERPKIRRLNRLPIFFFIGLVLMYFIPIRKAIRAVGNVEPTVV